MSVFSHALARRALVGALASGAAFARLFFHAPVSIGGSDPVPVPVGLKKL
jgi:ABC-type Na+ efflux pump permease subunit